MKDERLTDCPVEGCEGPVKRLLGTGAGIIFKGSGFYQTDYRSDSYKKSASAEKPAADSGGAAKTESKPAAPAATPSAPTKSET